MSEQTGKVIVGVDGTPGSLAALRWAARYAEDSGSELVREADHANLLVLGTRDLGGFAATLLGSVSARCLQHATCPVVVVRP